MAKWEEFIYYSPNPQATATIARLRKQRAKRRATKCWAMPDSEKRKELFAAGFSAAEVAAILAEADKPPQ